MGKFVLVACLALSLGCSKQQEAPAPVEKKGCCTPDSKCCDKPEGKCGCPTCKQQCEKTKKCDCDPFDCMDKGGCKFNCPAR